MVLSEVGGLPPHDGCQGVRMPPCLQRSGPMLTPSSSNTPCAVIITRRPGQAQRLRWRGAWEGGGQVIAASFVHQNSVPSCQMQCRMTDSLRATATRAFLAPTRCMSRVPQAFSGDQRCTFESSTLAAS